MTRLPLAALPLLLTAAAGALADIPVEEHSLSGPSRGPVAGAPANSGGSGGATMGGNTAWDQYTQLQQMQQQMQQLQGMIEEQGHQIEQLQNDLRVRYTDLDQRLSTQQQQLQQQQSAAAAAATSAVGMAQPGGTAAASNANIEEEKRAYLAAYDTFRAGGPDKAIPPMLAFVKLYPNSPFAPNAYYWLGEFYLNASTPDKDAAQKQFEAVLTRYPDHPKAPAALYKIASIEDLRGKPLEAKKQMQALLDKYPQSPEAALAQNYLKALEAATAPAPKPAAKAVKHSRKISRKN